MNILFVHQNFPGQFRHVAPALLRRGHAVSALTDSANQQPAIVPTWKYTWTAPDYGQHKPAVAAVHVKHASRGEAVAYACEKLKQTKGLSPDVVFAHPGWGEAMFLRDIWPAARHLHYAEFFYRPTGQDVGFDPEFSEQSLAARLRTLHRQPYLLQSYETADHLLSPTRWQAATLPAFAWAKTTVIHDGIDTEVAAPSPPGKPTVLTYPDKNLRLTEGDEVLTYVSRNLEPYRGFHIFMRALPKVMAARPKAQVIVVGKNDSGYGNRPRSGRTWQDEMLAEVGDRLDLNRLHFIGWQTYPVLVNLFRVSRAHVYLTYPFVLSWSLLDAMSTGAMVIASDTPPVREVITDGRNGRLVGFFNVAGWADAMIEALAAPERSTALRAAARRTVLDAYDLQRPCLPRQIAFIEKAAAGQDTAAAPQSA